MGTEAELDVPSEVKIGTLAPNEITGAKAALVFASQMVVSDSRSYELAAQEVRSVKERYNRIEAERQAIKAPLLDATRRLDSFFNRALDPLEQAEKLIKSKMSTHQQEEARKAAEIRRVHEEEQRRARLEAEREARLAKEKAEAEARRQREEQAAKEREAEAAAARARAATTQREKEKAERERKEAEEAARKAGTKAEQAIEKGHTNVANAMARAAETAAKPAPIAEQPTAAGTKTRMRRTAKVVDLKKLVAAVHENDSLLDTLLPNEKVLNKMASALGPRISSICPGVELVETPEVAVSTRG